MLHSINEYVFFIFIFLHIHLIYIIYTNRLAAMIYTQMYKTTLFSKSQCLPFWNVFFLFQGPRLPAVHPTTLTHCKGYKWTYRSLANTVEVVTETKSQNEIVVLLRENIRRNFRELGGTIQKFFGKLCFLLWPSLFFFQMQCEDVAQK